VKLIDALQRPYSAACCM